MSRLFTLLGKLGRRAQSVAMKQPSVKRRVEHVTARWRESRDNAEEWLESLEDELWQWVRRLQEEANRAHTQVERAANAASYYKTLGLKPGAGPDEVKKAWRRAMLENHPDRFAHDPVAEAAAHRRSQELNLAYTELSALLSGRGGDRRR